MKYVLHLTDIHGNIRAVKKIAQFLEIKHVEPSAVLISGDSAITTPFDMILYHVLTKRNLRRSDYARGVYGRYRSIFNKKQKKSLQQLDNLFKRQKWKSIFWIPGNTETREMVEFMEAELPHWINVQEKVIEHEPLRMLVSGYGFSLEHRGSDEIEYTMSDGEFYPDQFEPRVLEWTKKILQSFRNYDEKKYVMVLMFHEFPSFQMTSETGKEYWGGSKAVLRAIKTLQPHLALFGHFHELPLMSRYGESILMNPGPAMEYCFGLIALEEKKNGSIKIKTAKRIRLSPSKPDVILFIYSKRPQIDPSTIEWR